MMPTGRCYWKAVCTDGTVPMSLSGLLLALRALRVWMIPWHRRLLNEGQRRQFLTASQCWPLGPPSINWRQHPLLHHLHHYHQPLYYLTLNRSLPLATRAKMSPLFIVALLSLCLVLATHAQEETLTMRGLVELVSYTVLPLFCCWHSLNIYPITICCACSVCVPEQKAPYAERDYSTDKIKGFYVDLLDELALIGKFNYTLVEAKNATRNKTASNQVSLDQRQLVNDVYSQVSLPNAIKVNVHDWANECHLSPLLIATFPFTHSLTLTVAGRLCAFR